MLWLPGNVPYICAAVLPATRHWMAAMVLFIVTQSVHTCARYPAICSTLCTKYPAISAGLWLLLATFNQIIFREYPSIQLHLPVTVMSLSNTLTKYSTLIESHKWSIEWCTFRWPWGFKITKCYSEYQLIFLCMQLLSSSNRKCQPRYTKVPFSVTFGDH